MIELLNELRNRIINSCWNIGRDGMKPYNVIDETTINDITDELLEEVAGGKFKPTHGGNNEKSR